MSGRLDALRLGYILVSIAETDGEDGVVALVKCKECQQDISSKAKACPHCGADAGPKHYGCGSLLLAVFVIAAIGFAMTTSTSPSNLSRPAAAAAGGTEKTAVRSSQSPEQPALRASGWSFRESRDEMSGEVRVFAGSRLVEPVRRMSPPYQDVRAALYFGCDGGSEWAYFYFSEAPNLAKDETKSGYNLIETRLRWDESVESVQLTQDWGEKFLQFRGNDDSEIISKIRESGRVRLELSWYGQNQVYFDIPLSGSSASIDSARAVCARIESETPAA